MNFAVSLFSAFSSMVLVILAFVHIFVNFKLKYLKYVPIIKIIKYSIFCLLWNSIAFFITVYFKTNTLVTTLNLTLNDLIQVGLKLAVTCLLVLSMFSLLARNTENKKIIEKTYGKYAPHLIIIIFLICNILMYGLTKNFLDLAIGVVIVIPYIWYVFNLLSKWNDVTIDSTQTNEI